MRRKKSTLKILNIILKQILLSYMDQRASTDGCLNYEGVPTDGCSQIYAGDIEIIFQNVSAIQNSIKHENEYLVVVEEETRSTSLSPLELHEVGPSNKE